MTSAVFTRVTFSYGGCRLVAYVNLFADNRVMLIVLTTVPNFGEAETLARGIVEGKLAACVQILPQMTSVYVWEGEVQKENEHLLLIKTTQEKYGDLEAFITANHSYSVPEIVAVQLAKIAEPYRKWLEEAVSV
jgi:periplasmic divalent cation tolerance protein